VRGSCGGTPHIWGAIYAVELDEGFMAVTFLDFVYKFREGYYFKRGRET